MICCWNVVPEFPPVVRDRIDESAFGVKGPEETVQSSDGERLG